MRGNGSGSSTARTDLNTAPHQPLHQRHDLVLGQERGLDVDLREIRLAVGAQVLVAETAHDLVVAVEAADHQQLLEDLRRLRQREELARVRPRRHEVVARALRGRLGQHRRLDVDEAVRVEVTADRARQLVAHQQPLLHDLAPQVEVAELEADLLAHVLVELERQRLGAVEHGQFAGQELDLARGEVSVGGALRPRPHHARDRQYVLAAHALGLGEHAGSVRIEHDLQQAVAIAQVHEDDAAVVAATVDPAGDRDRLTDERLVDLTAVMGTHGSPRRPRHGEPVILRTGPCALQDAVSRDPPATLSGAGRPCGRASCPGAMTSRPTPWPEAWPRPWSSPSPPPWSRPCPRPWPRWPRSSCRWPRPCRP